MISKVVCIGFERYIKTRMPVTKKEKWASDILVKGRNEPATMM